MDCDIIEYPRPQMDMPRDEVTYILFITKFIDNILLNIFNFNHMKCLTTPFIYFLHIASNDVETHIYTDMSCANSSQRKKVSPVLVYFTKNVNGDYCCNIFKQSTPSREIIWEAL